jgi:TRAP-type mannitol/chloroaromatic compound transport system permease small subunit
MHAIERFIDGMNEWIGFATMFLILPLTAVVSFEVFMRYALNAPTIWAFEATTFLYGVHYSLGFGYTHQRDGHVSIDVITMRFSSRVRTILRIATNLAIFIPTVGLLTVWSFLYAATSWNGWERSWSSWAPPLYPFKSLMAVGFLALFLQGISKTIRDFRMLRAADERPDAPGAAKPEAHEGGQEKNG